MTRFFDSPRALVTWVAANLVGNMALIVTGGLVRVTASGLGCPTWPKCTDDSYVSHPEMGIHGAIEFGNRLLTFVLVALAIGTLIACVRARQHGAKRRDLTPLALLVALGVPLQAVIGGITVLTGLNPFVVALHLLVSVLMIVLNVGLLRRAYGSQPRIVATFDAIVARVTFALAMLAIVLGTVVTGSGPNAGDHGAARTGFDLETVAKVHAAGVWALGLIALICFIRLRTPESGALLIVLLGQGIVGYVQYFTHLPAALVVLHMLGVALTAMTAAALLFSVRTQPSSARREQPRSTPARASTG